MSVGKGYDYSNGHVYWEKRSCLLGKGTTIQTVMSVGKNGHVCPLDPGSALPRTPPGATVIPYFSS
ncbi:hypothetical protein L195_g063221, partial [Trifolium pratense]